MTSAPTSVTPGEMSALLNILSDFDEERRGQAKTQRAVLNVLADSEEERTRLLDSQRAVLNVLSDFDEERTRLVDTQRAVLNVLSDSDEERTRLADTQTAVLNILDDLEGEKTRVERVNDELSREVAERQRAERALRELTDDLETQVRSRTAELSTTNRELEAFAYSVAHDLRTQLRAIGGFSDILLDEAPGVADDRETLQRIRHAALRMGELIDSLLTLARLGVAAIHEEDVDLAPIARGHVVELCSAAPERRVEARVDESIPARGDPRLLRLVVRNLVDNAFKFSASRDTAHIDVGSRMTERGVAYFVSDDGVGFDTRGAGLLFGQFQRLHSERDFSGLGVGLAAVDRIVRRHGGRVWAESNLGQGATFYFQLGVPRASHG